MAISETTRAELAELASRYPQARSALLPMLHLVQSEEGYVSAGRDRRRAPRRSR